MCLGSCSESWSVSSSKKVSTVGGYVKVAWVAWRGVGRVATNFGVFWEFWSLLPELGGFCVGLADFVLGG